MDRQLQRPSTKLHQCNRRGRKGFGVDLTNRGVDWETYQPVLPRGPDLLSSKTIEGSHQTAHVGYTRARYMPCFSDILPKRLTPYPSISSSQRTDHQGVSSIGSEVSVFSEARTCSVTRPTHPHQADTVETLQTRSGTRCLRVKATTTASIHHPVLTCFIVLHIIRCDDLVIHNKEQ